VRALFAENKVRFLSPAIIFWVIPK